MLNSLVHRHENCLSFFSGDGHAVLIRALDPVDGVEMMKKHRGVKRSDEGEGLKDTDLGSGPSKLTQALGITRGNSDQKDLVTSKSIWLEDGDEFGEEEIVVSKRVGIESAEDWADKPLRFYVKGNKSVSVRYKEAEAKMDNNMTSGAQNDKESSKVNYQARLLYRI